MAGPDSEPNLRDSTLFAADTTSLREENRRLQRDLSRALEERNRLLKKINQPTETTRGGSRILEERLRRVRDDLNRSEREIQVLEEKNRLVEERLRSTGRIPAIFLSRLEEAIISVDGRIDAVDERIDNAADAPDRVANRFNAALEALWQVFQQHKVHDNLELRKQLKSVQEQLETALAERDLAVEERDQVTTTMSASQEEAATAAAQIAEREEKLTALRQRLGDLEAENLRLAKTTLQLRSQVKDLRGAIDPDLFSYIAETGKSAGNDESDSGFRGRSALLGLALGLVAAVGGGWLYDYFTTDAFESTIHPVTVGATERATVVFDETPAIPASATAADRDAATGRDDRSPASDTVFRDTLKTGRRGPDLIRLEGGAFYMGTDRYAAPEGERPARLTRVGQFMIGRYEITFDQYDAFARATGRPLPDDGGWGRGARPVINVSWNDATAYAKWLSAQTGHVYRLPTEAEWEFAMAGGDESIYWWGNDFQQGREICFNCGTRWDALSPAPVGSVSANPFGLYDMGGNVMEWVSDCGSTDCVTRTVRGGAFNKPSDSVRTTARRALEARTPFSMVGFRLVRELP